MAGIIKLFGSIFLLLGMFTIFFGENFKGFFPEQFQHYFQDFYENRWFAFILGLILSTLGTITSVKKKIKEKRSFQSKTSVSLNGEVNHTKRNFAADKMNHQAQQLADKQHGKLKDLAVKLDWSPLSGGGANFKTASLRQINQSRIEVVKSKGAFLFSVVFLVFGIGIIVLGCYSTLKEGRFGWEVLIPSLIGLVFSAIGFAMLYWPRSRVFDRRQGWYWAGSKSLVREQELMKLKSSARLNEISAIQILSERMSSKNGSYTSWELNLVSEEGQRLNVMDHGNYESLLSDAQRLSEFLNVPIWENT